MSIAPTVAKQRPPCGPLSVLSLSTSPSAPKLTLNPGGSSSCGIRAGDLTEESERHPRSDGRLLPRQ